MYNIIYTADVLKGLTTLDKGEFMRIFPINFWDPTFEVSSHLHYVSYILTLLTSIIYALYIATFLSISL